MTAIEERAPNPAHCYEIPQSVKSKLILGEMVRLESHYRCPRCGLDVGEIKHGATATCSGCDIKITRYGNGLHLAGTAK